MTQEIAVLWYRDGCMLRALHEIKDVEKGRWEKIDNAGTKAIVIGCSEQEVFKSLAGWANV